jgi:hypothetical protein
VHQPTTVQALLKGGPGDRAIRHLECGPDGRPPALLMLGGGKAYVGISHLLAPPEHAIYELEPAAEPIESLWPHRHVETLTASRQTGPAAQGYQ